MENRSFKFFSAALLLFAVLSSCTKTVVDKEVYVDSYIRSIFNTTDTIESNRYPVYSVMHSAYCFTKLGSIGVTGSVTPAVQLTDFGDQGFSFYNNPDSSKYTATVPSPETYTYNVSYASGEVASKIDATIAESLMPARKLNAVKNATDITLSWKPVANAEAYKIRIWALDSNSQNALIYESDFLVPKDAITDLSMPFSLVSFSQYLSTTITFEVSAFIFEQNQDTYNAVSVTTIQRNFGN